MDWDNIAHVRIHARAAEAEVARLAAALDAQRAALLALEQEMREKAGDSKSGIWGWMHQWADRLATIRGTSGISSS